MTESHKTLGLLHVLGWIVGGLVILSGIYWVFVNPIGGFLIIFAGLVIIPKTNDLIKEQFSINLSTPLRIAIFFVLLVIGSILVSSSGDFDFDNNVQVVDSSQSDSQPAQSSSKVKSAEIEIQKVNYQLANLESVRVTIKNTGDVSITPDFDVYIYDPYGDEMPTNSMFDEFGTIRVGETKTGEISVIEMFSDDGTYTIKIDLLDKNYNILDSDSKEFTINYWNRFDFDF